MRKYFSFFIIVLLLFVVKVNAAMKAPVDITTMSINDLAEALDKGYITSEILVNLYLERIEAYDEQFNSINQLNEHALEQAKELDKERENGNVRSKLHGIPILVKCNIDVYGMPTTAGTKALKDNYPKENSYAVKKLIDAGAIVLGSTNMSELAFSAKNSYSSYGYVRNVFNNKYTPYGSSGGSAVAVKAAFAAASLGTDTNSSVRLPASGAGLVGIRPTFGLVSRTGVIPYDINRDTIGILSSTVADNALILSIISGEDKNDSVTKNASSYVYNSDTNFSLKGINIGVPTQYLNGKDKSGVTSSTNPDIYNLAVAAIEEMKKEGANIIYIDDFVKSSNLTIASSTQTGYTLCDGFNEYIKGTTGTIRSFQALAKSSGHVQLLSGYVKHCGAGNSKNSSNESKKAIYRNHVDSYFEKYDLDAIIYPTLKNKPWIYNDSNGSNISPGSSLGSVIGYPSITVPMGYDEEGFSYGLEFLGNAFSEEMLYNITIEFERVNGNVVSTSSLTPALYEIPPEVTELIVNYEKALSSNSNNKKVTKWLDSVKEYFRNYNNYDDVGTKAKMLLERYESDNIENIFDKSFFNLFDKNNLIKVLVYVLFGVMTGVIVVIFFNEFFEKN